MKTNNFIIDYKKSIFFILIPIIFYFCYLTSLRSPYFPDYQMYMHLFYNERDYVEYSFNLLASFFEKSDSGFLSFLFLYAILGFGLQIFFLTKYIYMVRNVWWYFLSLVLYFPYFYLYWGLIQIRYAAGISFLLLGLMSDRLRNQILLFSLAIFFHNTMLMPALLFMIFSYLKNKIVKLCLIPILVLISVLGISFTRYKEKYSDYGMESFGYLSGNMVLLYCFCLVFFFFRGDVIQNFKVKIMNIYFVVIILLLWVLIFNLIMPIVANRFLTLNIFLAAICCFFIKNKYSWILITALIFLFSIWNIEVLILRENEVFTP